jgi:hypothetical protein
LNVCVGKESIERAVLIMDRILKSAESCGFKVRMEKEPPCRTVVIVDGEELSIVLKEKTNRKDHVPTPAEKLEMKRLKYMHGVPKWDFSPSGKLVLAIDSMGSNERKWSDGERTRIEDRLASFGHELARIAKGIKECRARAEEQKRIWAEEERRRQKAAYLQAQEKRRTDELERQASSWVAACSLRRFVQAVREEATRRAGAFEPDSPIDRWLRGAEKHADEIDPVSALVNDLTTVQTVSAVPESAATL